MLRFLKILWGKITGFFSRETLEEKKVRQQLEMIEENDPFIYK